LVVIPVVKGWRDKLERMYGRMVRVVEMGPRTAAAECLLSRADRGDGRDGRIC